MGTHITCDLCDHETKAGTHRQPINDGQCCQPGGVCKAPISMRCTLPGDSIVERCQRGHLIKRGQRL